MYRIRVSLGPYGDWLKMRDEDEAEAERPSSAAAGCSASLRLLWQDQARKPSLRVNKQKEKSILTIGAAE